MDIALYPVPYQPLSYPQPTDTRAIPASKSGLSPRQEKDGSAGEPILQGEVLDRQRRRAQDSRQGQTYSAGQQARQARPDLSGLGSSSRNAVEAYLQNSEFTATNLVTRSLIDLYA